MVSKADWSLLTLPVTSSDSRFPLTRATVRPLPRRKAETVATWAVVGAYSAANWAAVR